MSRDLDNKLRGSVLSALQDGLSRFLGTTVDLGALRFEFSTETSAVGPPSETPILTVAAPDVASVLGQFPPFSEREATGFLIPFLRGWMSAIYPHDARWGGMLVDIDEHPARTETSASTRFVALAEALEKGWLDEESELAVACHRFGLASLLRMGSYISGPSAALLNVLENFLLQDKPNSLLDLFSGTGAAAIIGARHSVKSIKRVDLSPCPLVDESARDMTETIAADVMGLDLSHEKFDLVVADPFYGQTYAVACWISRELAGSVASVVIFNGGRSALIHHQERVRHELELGFQEVSAVDLFSETVYLCRGSDVRDP